MNEKNKKFNVELHITLKTYLNNIKDLFMLSSTKEIFNKKYIFSQQDKELYIISYPDINDKKTSDVQKEITDIIVSEKLKEIIKIYPSLKIISFIKFEEKNNSFTFYNTFKCQKNLNTYKTENCERFWKLLPQKELNQIFQGDIIKLGYISLKFDKIYISKNKNYSDSQNNLQSNGNIKVIQEKKVSFASNSSYNENEKFCRICYQKENGPIPENYDRDDSDPLISVCKCTNSMRYVHLSCLKNKINLNLYKKHHKNHDIYLFQNYNCDICLATYPKYIIIDNRKISLLDIDTSNYENYAICDMIKYDEKNEYIFRIGYLVLHFEEGSVIKFGRNKENNVVFNDLSISGNHCELICQNNNLFLKDVGSIYGCLKYIQNEYEIIGENEGINNSTIFISGNNEFEVNLIKNEALFDFDWINFIKNLFVDNKCCSNSFKDKGDVYVVNNLKDEDINENNKPNTEENKTMNSKMKYFEKFEDCDSYNDYIINMDNENYL